MSKLRNVREQQRRRYMQRIRTHGSFPAWHMLCAGRRTYIAWCHDRWIA